MTSPSVSEINWAPRYSTLYGNRRDGLKAGTQDDTAIDNLAHAARMADRRGATVVLEPLSGISDCPLRTAADAIAVMDRVRDETDVSSLRLLADIHHLYVNGDDVTAVIDAHTRHIGHVQVADAPGRGPPGTGVIDLTGHLARLSGRGYRGLVGLDYHPGRIRSAGSSAFPDGYSGSRSSGFSTSSMLTSLNVITRTCLTKRAGRYMSHTQASASRNSK